MNNWRAVAHTVRGEEHLLYIGMSAEQVKKNYAGTFYEILTAEEQTSVNKVTLEKWNGKPTAGHWNMTDSLKVPRIHKSANK